MKVWDGNPTSLTNEVWVENIEDLLRVVPLEYWYDSEAGCRTMSLKIRAVLNDGSEKKIVTGAHNSWGSSYLKDEVVTVPSIAEQ